MTQVLTTLGWGGERERESEREARAAFSNSWVEGAARWANLWQHRLLRPVAGKKGRVSRSGSITAQLHVLPPCQMEGSEGGEGGDGGGGGGEGGEGGGEQAT